MLKKLHLTISSILSQLSKAKVLGTVYLNISFPYKLNNLIEFMKIYTVVLWT